MASVIDIGTRLDNGSRDRVATVLESIAADVRAGRIGCVAIATTVNPDCIGTGVLMVDGKENLAVLMGAVTILQARIVRLFDST